MTITALAKKKFSNRISANTKIFLLFGFRFLKYLICNTPKNRNIIAKTQDSQMLFLNRLKNVNPTITAKKALSIESYLSLSTCHISPYKSLIERNAIHFGVRMNLMQIICLSPSSRPLLHMVGTETSTPADNWKANVCRSVICLSALSLLCSDNIQCKMFRFCPCDNR